MRERTVTISGASKTFSVTGWRIGWIVAPADLTDAIRKVHDFLTVGAPAPLQEGVAAALDGLPAAFYDGLAATYRGKRDLLHAALDGRGLPLPPPRGRVLHPRRLLRAARRGRPRGSPLDDTAFAVWLSREIGVTPVPGSSFYREGGGRSLVRFVFCKTEEILAEAARRLGDAGRRVAADGPRPARAEAPAVESGLQR